MTATTTRSRMRIPAVLLAASLVAAGCGGEDPASGPATDPIPTTTPTASPAGTPTPTGTATPTGNPTPADALPPVTDPVSLAALMRVRFEGGRIRLGREEAGGASYTRHQVTYRSGDLTVSGVLLRPRGRGPFPAVVLNHGYIDPDVYVTGQGLRREQDALAAAGFVVLHTDYRGHAASDAGRDEDRETRLGYTRDAIDAVQSLRRLSYVDRDRIAMLGRSMGGAVTMNALVARPGLVRAAVLYAPVSSAYLDNLRRWTLPQRPEAAQRLFRRHGTPAEAPEFYRGLSARTHFDRITEPVLIHHGTLDESCPLPWSRTTQRLLRRAGVDSRLEVYDGEQHAFGPQWPLAMDRTIRFLRRELGVRRTG